VAPYRRGGHGKTCFSVPVDAHYKFMFDSGSIIWAAHRFCLFLVLSVLLIATCGRLSWPALWTTFGRTIK